MSISVLIIGFLIVAFIMANLPWIYSYRWFLIDLKGRYKSVWMRFSEWLLLYFLVGILALGIEKNVTGAIYEKGWEFLTISFLIFLIFATPSFIYRYEFIKYIK